MTNVLLTGSAQHGPDESGVGSSLSVAVQSVYPPDWGGQSGTVSRGSGTQKAARDASEGFEG